MRNEKLLTGLVSVTFRQLSPKKIIQLTAQAGLNGIEWGGDIHVPAGDIERASQVRRMTEASNLQVFSYGSYFYLSDDPGWEMDFRKVLHTADALGAPLIRIWAGQTGSMQTGESLRRRLTGNLASCCSMAAACGKEIALEYHRRTLTDTASSTKRLIEEVSCRNLSTYWQPNPDLSQAEHLQELTELKPYISQIHVFQWASGDVRLSLSQGISEWEKYLAVLDDRPHHCLLEFVQNNSPEQFLRDAGSLHQIVANSSPSECKYR